MELGLVFGHFGGELEGSDVKILRSNSMKNTFEKESY
jgi:hypothetical protein